MFLYLFAHWYDLKSPNEELRNWEDLKNLPWYGDKMQEKLKFVDQLDDIMEDIGEDDFNRREDEVHVLILKKL